MCSTLLLPFSSSQTQLHVTFSSNTVLESSVEYVGPPRLPTLKSSMQPRIVKFTESQSTLADGGARVGQGGGGGVSMCSVTLFDPMDYSTLASSYRGIFQARILDWVAISFSKGSSPTRDRTRITHVSYIGREVLSHLDFPGDSDGKASAYNAGDPSSTPGSGRSPGEGSGNPLQYSCLENPMEEDPGRLQTMESQKVGHD